MTSVAHLPKNIPVKIEVFGGAATKNFLPMIRNANFGNLLQRIYVYPALIKHLMKMFGTGSLLFCISNATALKGALERPFLFAE